jgi:periplasmic protein TonB
MTQGGFFEPRRLNPGGLTIVIALHAAALTALALSKTVYVRDKAPVPKLIFIPDAIDPPPVIDEPIKPKVKEQHKSQVDVVRPVTPTIPSDVVFTHNEDIREVTFDTTPIGDVDVPPPLPQPAPEPVRTEAQLDPRYADRLQPPYPTFEQRAGMEGTVKLRIVIGADGRVKAVEKIAAASEGFFKAAQRQALSQWRFKPATVDGRAVESSKVLTLRFKLENA